MPAAPSLQSPASPHHVSTAPYCSSEQVTNARTFARQRGFPLAFFPSPFTPAFAPPPLPLAALFLCRSEGKAVPRRFNPPALQPHRCPIQPGPCETRRSSKPLRGKLKAFSFRGAFLKVGGVETPGRTPCFCTQKKYKKTTQSFLYVI